MSLEYLMDLEGDQAALVLLAEDGEWHAHQTGGVSLNHPQAKGYIVELPDLPYDFNDPLHYNVWSDIESTERWLKASGFDRWFEPLDGSENLANLTKFHPDVEGDALSPHEAWIPCRIRYGVDLPELLKDYKGWAVVICYANSD